MRIETGSDPFTVVLYTYNSDGKVETEMYFDGDMQPIRSVMNGYGIEHCNITLCI